MWHRVLMDLPLWDVRDVTRLPLATSPASSQTSVDSGQCLYCDAYTLCQATTQYTRSSEHTTEAVFSVDRATTGC
jgi:hypothetical protein